MALLETSLDRWALRWALAWILGWALVCVVTPIEVGFDVLHYHIHNGWSAWHDRLTRDIAPAGMHSYFNPLANAIAYRLIATLPAALVTFLLGAVQALMLLPLYVLGRRVLSSVGHASRVSALLLALAGYFTYSVMTVTASVRTDHWACAPFLVALLVLVPEDGRRVGWRRAALAAFLVGLSVGLKLTSIIYAAGIAAAILVAVPGARARIEAVTAAALAGLAGILLTGGWWMWKLWVTLGNPVFPMANGIFHSPFGLPENFADTRSTPKSILDVLLFPINGAWRPYNEFGSGWLQDFPSGLLYAAILMFVILGVRTRLAVPDVRRPSRALMIVFAGAVGTLAVWFPLFMVGRYAMAVWMVSPLIFGTTLILVWPAVGEGRRPILWFGGVLAACLFTANTVPMRRVPVREPLGPYIDVEVPASVSFDDAIVLFTGPYPSAFLAAYLPDSATFMFTQTQPWTEPAEHVLNQMVQRRVAAARAPVVAIIGDAGANSGPASVPVMLSRMKSELGLVADPDACRAFVTSVDTRHEHWLACPMRREG